DRVLVKNQAVAKDNGIYIAAAPAWVRAPDADTNAEVTSALLVSVEQGTALADTRWQQVTDGVIVLGVTALTFQNITQGFAALNAPVFTGDARGVTAPQFDSDASFATTEFVRRALGSYSGQANYTGDTVLTVASVGQLTVMDGISTVTLPDASAVPPGSLITVVGNNTYTVRAKAGDTLASSNSLAGPFTFAPQVFSVFRRLLAGSGWTLDSGDGALKYSPIFAALFSSNGYQKLPSGLIIQWGTASVSANNVLTNAALPIAWPNGLLQCVSSWLASSPPNGSLGCATGTNPLTQISLFNSYTVAQNARWIAVGN
ncbi:MAG: gp53-like domain-containing protein, partial [Pseudomonas fluorescens]